VAQTPYDDGLIRLDEQGITLRRYYFPWAGAKKVAYGRIKAVRSRPVGLTTGAWRIWGSGDLRHWLPLDTHRRHRTRAIALDVGRWIRPTCTPAEPEQVLAILRDHVDGPVDNAVL
jgi:hypothetical protein